MNIFFHKDGGSPAACLRFARLTLTRLGLNDGAKLWVSFKLCFKTNYFSAHIGELHYKGLDVPSPLDFGRIEGAARQWQRAVFPLPPPPQF